jgi:hypothetical protein
MIHMSSSSSYAASGRRFSRLSGPLPLLICCMLTVLVFAGCIKSVLPPLDESRAPGKTTQAPTSPLDEARKAYSSGNYGNAEALAMRLVDDSSLRGPDKAEAGRILAASALRTNHPNVALTGLDRWREAEAGADAGKEWQDAWCKAMRELSSYDARTKANDLYQDSSRPLPARRAAGVYMAVRQWQDGELGQTMPALENIYVSATTDRERADVERRLAMELARASQEASALAAGSVTEQNNGKFPYNIITIDKLLRQSASPERQAALDAVREKGNLADPSLVNGPPSETEISIRTATAVSGPISGKPVVLALPMSGQFAGLSSKIVAGAQAACDDMGKASLIVIDTSQPDWVTRVDGLPPDAVVVGGVLRREDYHKAKSAGLLSRRAFFTFLASLDSGDEGRVAWRFFNSPKDQIDTLVRFADKLGISTYGVFYPDGRYGQGMADLFASRAREGGAKEVYTGSYSPEEQTGWTSAAKDLLTSAKGGTPFRALFLPDSWKNMDTIVPSFFYYNETRLLLMGTTFWEQALSGNAFVSTQYYKLAVFPGLWNSAQPTAAGQRLISRLSASGKQADYWSGLGYDFARFSSGLGLQQGWQPDTVNGALGAASSLDWSIAPLSWANGVASQRMFLFTPADKGYAPVDEQAFAAEFDAAWKK